MSNITTHHYTVRLQNSKQPLQSIELFRVPNTQTIRIRDTKTLRVSESPASAFVTAGNFIRYTAPNGRVYLLQAEKPTPTEQPEQTEQPVPTAVVDNFELGYFIKVL